MYDAVITLCFLALCIQVHEMAVVSSIQEAQKDNLRSFNDYMMQVLEVRILFLVYIFDHLFLSLIR